MSNPTTPVHKLWNYCNILWDDSLPYVNYVEQLTLPPFLKLAGERSRPPFNKPSAIMADVEPTLSVVEELESVVTANLPRATHLHKSILQKAFSGELVL